MNNDLKDVIREFLALAESIEEYGRTEKLSFRDIVRFEMMKYVLYLSAADGVVKQSEVDLINNYLDWNLTLSEWKDFINRHNVYSEDFANTIPRSLKAFVEADNNYYRQDVEIDSRGLGGLFIATYEGLGRELINIDEDIDDQEEEDFDTYISNLKDYVDEYAFRNNPDLLEDDEEDDWEDNNEGEDWEDNEDDDESALEGEKSKKTSEQEDREPLKDDFYVFEVNKDKRRKENDAFNFYPGSIAERGFKEYFKSDEYGRYDRDKQNLDAELENVADFLTNNLAEFKKDDSEETKQKEIRNYRVQGESAFKDNHFKEAAKYYEKILSMDANDADATFYISVCAALNSGPNERNMDIIFDAYIRASEDMPVDIDWREKRIEYSKQLAGLAIAWYRELNKIEWDRHKCDWYPDTIKEFYENRRLYRKCITYLQNSFPVILDSDMSNREKEENYAFWFSSLCSDYCTETLYYKVRNHDLAISSSRYCGSLGLALSKKADVVKIYDDLCFEVRKFNPKFELCGAIDEDGWEINEGGFYRMDPPTTYENQQSGNRQRPLLQKAKDRETTQRLARWKSEGGPQKEERNRRFWEKLSSNIEKRTEYQTLEKDRLKKKRACMNERLNEQKAQNEKKQIRERMSDTQSKKEVATTRITKLEKKIFGKAKAQEEIKHLQMDISNYDITIKKYIEEEKKIDGRIQSIRKKIGQLEMQENEAAKMVKTFMGNCLL